MASMRDIKRRKTSIQSTSQITKAMKLVSTVKLQKARQAAENAKPYFENTYDVIVDMLSITDIFTSKYLSSPNIQNNKKKSVILISSNRGLAGGYNNNVCKTILEDKSFIPSETKIYAVGLKGAEILGKRGFEVDTEFLDVIEQPLYSDAMKISDEVLSDFMDGEFGEIYIAYTEFKNTVSQVPKLLKLLPVDKESIETKKNAVPMNYEPNQHTSLDIIIPKYVTSIIYGALLEAMASENGARMTAMDSATENAEDMIDKLSLEFNRARQSAITQELTEIIAGSESIG